MIDRNTGCRCQGVNWCTALCQPWTHLGGYAIWRSVAMCWPKNYLLVRHSHVNV